MKLNCGEIMACDVLYKEDWKFAVHKDAVLLLV